jgi:hypothetical protein
VLLTDEGAARLEAAYERVVSRGLIRRMIHRVLGAEGRPDERSYEAMGQLDWHLHALRKGFRDTGSLQYRF